VEINDIKLIIDLMAKSGLTEFELEKDNVKIRIKRGLDGTPIVSSSPVAIASAPIGAPAALPVAAPASGLKEIKSPMVGTFYRSPSPEAPYYVEIGQAVTEDTVVCIIEAMKVMNEIKAEVRGVIAEILLENGKPVEYGKPLFRVKTS
jgi:acetyl-CoA carboxylase biotin carboxyl carrier protein